MTERERLHALLLCSAIIETATKIEHDLAAAKQAAIEFAASIENLRHRMELQQP